MKDKSSDVDKYINSLPKEKRIILTKLRKIIKTAAPKTTEKISYGIPTFDYNGRHLIGYAAFKDHYSLFPMNSALIQKLKNELKEYKTAKGTIQFTKEKPLPTPLIKKIVKERMRD
ncbi:Uncharacterised protein [Candidatus Tiddalikarchaeum anstoanum]|nr:Uncharacterised protein [Candidatus Tiddalikarchaeum anstoanum]